MLLAFYRLFFLVPMVMQLIWAQPSPTEQVQPEKDTITNQIRNSIAIQDFGWHRKSLAKKNKGSITAETNYFTATINSRGGVITSWLHKDPINPLKNNIELVGDDIFRFALYMTSNSQIQQTNVTYTLSKTETQDHIEIKALSPPAKAIAKNKTEYPIQIVKIYRFYKKLHYWEYSFDIINRSSHDLHMPEAFFIASRPIGPIKKNISDREASTSYNFYHTDGSFENISFGSGSPFGCSGDDSDRYINTAIDFFGSSSRFMIMVLQPMFPSSGLHIFKQAKEIHLAFPNLFLPKKQQKSHRFTIYTGPKVNKNVKLSYTIKQRYSFLKTTHNKLYTAFNFGVTAPIRDLIVWFLSLIYQFIPNYGWAIIIFSLLLKILFFPLNQKQANSMKKMGTLQPLLKEINEKYKNNLQEKQKRTMVLYKEHKVNPLSGCLPMLIQIPVFIALYTAFSDSYQLWRSPFIQGWVNDLSQPDTIYIVKNSIPLIGGFHINVLPILMSASQWWQSKLTVVSTDQNQQKILQFMPLILIFFFWNMPAGVVLYWTFQNLLSIAQQLITNQYAKQDTT